MKFFTELLESAVREWSEKPKKLGLSYVLCALGFFGFAGLHRLYLDKPISGILYFCTWGFAGLGTIFDLWQLPKLVQAYNHSSFLPESTEKEILIAAKKHRGVLTALMVSIETSLSLFEAKRRLNKLYLEGHCRKDIDEDGVEIYEFRGLEAKRPLYPDQEITGL